MGKPVVDRDWARRCIISMVHEFALDPDEAFECATIGGSKAHPAIFLDEMGEVELHYSTGWKNLLSNEEQEAVERFIACENSLPLIEDEIWDDPQIMNNEWTSLRQEARKLIEALGGLPADLPGCWAEK